MNTQKSPERLRPAPAGSASQKHVNADLLAESVALIDVVLMFAAALLAALYLATPEQSWLERTLAPSGHALIVSALALPLFRWGGLYTPQQLLGSWPGLIRLTAFVALLGLAYLGLLVALDSGALRASGWILLWFGLAWALLVLARGIAALVFRMLAAEGSLRQRIALYGSSELCLPLVSAIGAHAENAMVVGIFNDPVGAGLAVPVNGNLADLVAAVREGQIDRIVVAVSSRPKEQLDGVVKELSALPVTVQLSPDAMSLPFGIKGAQRLGELLLVDVQRPPLNSRQYLLKSVFDYVMSAIALVILAPVMLLIAAAIKLDSRGSVLFVQSRNGYNDRLVRVIKFRTMHVMEDGPVVTQATRGDPRVTRVGRFLRRTSLDELPQLFNVLQGELSMVGPRPHAVAHNKAYEQLIPDYVHRVRMKPGITGWAQINGSRGETRDAVEMRDRVRLDLWYIDNWSFWLDLRILMRTLIVPFERHAY